MHISLLFLVWRTIDTEELLIVAALHPLGRSAYEVVCIGDEYVQQAGAKFQVLHNLCYHIFLVWSDVSQPDAIMYSFDDSFDFGTQ